VTPSRLYVFVLFQIPRILPSPLRRKFFFMRRCLVLVIVVTVALILLVACGGGETPTPSVPPRPSARPSPIISPTPSRPPPTPTPTDLFVSILNRRMTRADIANEIQKEGWVTVAGWNYEASDAIVEQFEAWVKKLYGVDVTLNYLGAPSPDEYLTKLYAAREAGNPAPYDVVAVEESYYADAKRHDAVEEIYPSDIMPDWARVEAFLRHDPYAVAFQSTSTPGATIHADAVGDWFHDWKDLADPRLQLRITLPKAGDLLAGGFLIGVAGSLDKDYKNPDEMREAIDFICTSIAPNVYKFTSDYSEMQELLRQNRIDVAIWWNLLARFEGLSGADGTQDVVFRPMRSGQAAINGYVWIPKGAPHPVLAQLFIEWRLSDEGQLPSEAWGLHNLAWTEYHEGLLGDSYEAAIPQWIRGDYFKYYPRPSDVAQLYKAVDWDYYAAHEGEWMGEYSKCAK